MDLLIYGPAIVAGIVGSRYLIRLVSQSASRTRLQVAAGEYGHRVPSSSTRTGLMPFEQSAAPKNADDTCHPRQNGKWKEKQAADLVSWNNTHSDQTGLQNREQ